MQTSAGLARAHSVSSPQAEFSFSGSARLSAGETTVSFASAWQECISGAAAYRVLITPTEMCNGIACVEKTPTGFKAKELMNGTGSASFDWMVRGVKKGSSTERILLSGAGQADVGMEIIDESKINLMLSESQKGKRMLAARSPALSSVKRPADVSEQRIQRVREYKERLRQRAQNK
jgi:hypothetical protein